MTAMKKAVVLTIVLPISLAAASRSDPQAGVIGPRLVAAEPIKDLGSVRKGDKVTHDFAIRNEGGAPLTITDVKSACDCVTARFDKTIAPGQTGLIHLTLDTAALFGPTAKSVTVMTTDAAHPELQLTLRAAVTSVLNVKPGFARFTLVRGESGAVESLQTITASDGASFDVLRAEASAGLNVTFREATADERVATATGKQWVVRIVLQADVPIGALAESVRLTTSHPQQPLVEIPITGFVRPLVTTTPVMIDLGQVVVSAPLRRTIAVRNISTQPIAVTSAESTVKGIDVAITPVQEGREYQVTITVNPTIAKGPLIGKVIIHTDSQKLSIVEVQLKGEIR